MLSLSAGLMLTADLFGQVQVYTRKEKLKDFTSKTTKVVLTGDSFLDEALKESVASVWTVSPYEFCTAEEFKTLKKSGSFYFLMVVKTRMKNELSPGISMLTLVKGGPEAEKSIEDMLEVVSFPLRAAEEPGGREFILLPAFLSIIQEHVSSLADSEMKAYSNLRADNKKKLKIKRIYFSKNDIAPHVDDRLKKSLDQDILLMDDDEMLDEAFIEHAPNVVVSYVVAPSDPVDGAVCYKMLIGTDTHGLYWYNKHKITSRRGAGFLSSDLRSIRRLRR